ncbi:hypothetical protein BDA96_01G167100 [Sorghum bicolor]|uniref:Uncharacterized protein n=1 Tax=Sorghum bicolor TaxID=4558 RepID=A0A921RYX3_SORBI|nr:hypothetical protein BDA96_01G167100 [Sorghum bicolor]
MAAILQLLSDPFASSSSSFSLHCLVSNLLSGLAPAPALRERGSMNIQVSTTFLGFFSRYFPWTFFIPL